MAAIKQVLLGAAIAGVMAGGGTALGSAVAHADAGNADATHADTRGAGNSRSATGSESSNRADAGSRGRSSGAVARAGEDRVSARGADQARAGSAASTRRKASDARDDAPMPAVQDGPNSDAPATAPRAATVPAEPVSPTTNADLSEPPAAPPTPVAVQFAAPAPAPAVAQSPGPKVTLAAAPAAAVAPALILAPPALAPPAPAPTPLRLPLLPDLPAVPLAPAGSVAASTTSGTSTRIRAASAVAQAAALADPPVNHVLLIGTDGTNLSKVLEYVYDDPDSGFRIAMDEGITGATSLIGHTTISGPSWSTILTGAWDNKTGVINNLFNPKPYQAWPTAINLIEYNKPDVITAVVADWQYINDIAGAGGYPADVNEFVTFTNTWEDTDDAVTAKTLALIGSTAPTASTFIFSYQVAVDEAGHAHGGASPEYRAAVINTSENIAQILDAVDAWETANPSEQWTVIVTTDHGHQQSKGFGHGFQSPNETSSFVIFDLEGDDANDGKQNLGYKTADITPTIVDLFGIGQRSDFDGVPLSDKTDGIVTPVNLKQSLSDAIASYGYPNIGTDVALGTRTVFASIPYLIDGFVTNITNTLQSLVDRDIFLISGLAAVTKWIVQFNGDLAVGVTQALARVVARLTGAGSIPPSDPPLPAPPANSEFPLLLEGAVLT